MGFRYRKSINLGGGARITLSKSGIGYSWGGKGFRFTKTANGRKRSTVFLPGTGLSYVSESSGKKRKKSQRKQVKSNTTDDTPITISGIISAIIIGIVSVILIEILVNFGIKAFLFSILIIPLFVFGIVFAITFFREPREYVESENTEENHV